jgi:Sulfotransferase family
MRPQLQEDVRGAPSLEDRNAVNPYAFIVGCPRSGTTLLRRMLDANREIAITRETHWIPKRLESRTGVRPDGRVAPGLLSSLLNDHRFRRMGLDEGELRSLVHEEPPPTYAAFVSAVFDLYGRAQSKALVGDKTPSYVTRIPMLHGLWPSARFVHLIRDGRDVVLSLLAWKRTKLPSRIPGWREQPVIAAALFWDRRVRLGVESGRGLGDRHYHEMRYESLITRPAEESARLCEFLGVPYDDAMLRFHEGRERHQPGLSAKKAWRPITPGLRDWRSEMGPRDVERFEAAAGELLEELGYRRAVARPRRDLVVLARRVRDSFAEALVADSAPVPRGWLS